MDRDTLDSIALSFDTSPSLLMRLNHRTSRMIFPGQVSYPFPSSSSSYPSVSPCSSFSYSSPSPSHLSFDVTRYACNWWYSHCTDLPWRDEHPQSPPTVCSFSPFFFPFSSASSSPSYSISFSLSPQVLELSTCINYDLPFVRRAFQLFLLFLFHYLPLLPSLLCLFILSTYMGLDHQTGRVIIHIQASRILSTHCPSQVPFSPSFSPLGSPLSCPILFLSSFTVPCLS